MAYSWIQDPGKVKDVARAVLTQLAQRPMLRIDLQRAIYESTFTGSYSVIDALRFCSEKHYIERTPSRRWKITDLGREWLAFADGPDGAA